MRFSCLLPVVFLCFSVTVSAEPVRTKHVTADLVTENLTLEASATSATANFVGVRLEMIPHWHTYWRFPGDSGLPTEIKWELPKGWSAGGILWPTPKRMFVPPLVNYGYEGEVILGSQLSVPAGTVGEFPVLAHVSWLVCKEECVPEKADVSVRVKVLQGKPIPGPLALEFEKLRAQQPQVYSPVLNTLFRPGKLGIELPNRLNPEAFTDFLPLVPMLVKGDSPPKVERGAERSYLWFDKAEPFDEKVGTLSGVLIGKRSDNIEITARLSPAGFDPLLALSASSQSEERASPLALLVFAFLGGLILNLMPCVFPVLGIKVMSLVKQGGNDRFHARAHGHAYTFGVIFCFLLLAGGLLILRSAGESVGWGFQLQQPMFVTALVLLFSFVAMDLAGFVRWSGRWMGAGSSLANRDGLSGSFFTGVLAVVVATPCTAPFMGTAVGAAIGEPPWVVLLVFSLLGVGLALPFLILCYQPKFLAALPKPGAWMERLKELFAFPMVATVLWLLWVLSQQVGADGVLKVELGLMLLGISLWSRRKFSGPVARGLSHLVLFIGILSCGIGARGQAVSSTSVNGPWKPYSETALAAALNSGKPVFVDFTAAWCLTCQVNRKLVLERENVLRFFSEKGVVLLLADWTNKDPEITKALERQGRLGVPLYLAYRAGSPSPEVLPQVLTEERIRLSFP